MECSIKDLAEYRLQRAVEELATAHELSQFENYRLALTRIYYAIFYAMRAVNAYDNFDSGKHSGVIAHFNQFHVKTGDFDKKLSRIIKRASDLREEADYKDFYIADEDDVQEMLTSASEFVEAVRLYISAKSSLPND